MLRLSPASLARDLSASLVVFLVALPLCMGIAVASGVPPQMGLLAGIVGVVVVGLIGGAPLQVGTQVALERTRHGHHRRLAAFLAEAA
jgi:MFS superfamily sulfate permease-like transporter